LLDILSIHWELKTENSWWSGIRNYCQYWVLKLKIKMSRCCITLNNMLRKLPVMMEASTSNLNPLD